MTHSFDRYYDISPVVGPETAVYPGDIPFSREFVLAWDQGNHLQLSGFRSTVHVGAHADAPNHYDPQGGDMAERSLHYYMGPCQTVTVQVAPRARIYPKDIEGVAIAAPRVLFKTSSFLDRENWKTDYNSLSPELIDLLAAKKVILVGIDTPSVDPDDSKALESHQALRRHDMANLEGLDLEAVPDGTYTLIALPLKLTGSDGSPVRAVLLRDQTQ